MALYQQGKLHFQLSELPKAAECFDHALKIYDQWRWTSPEILRDALRVNRSLGNGREWRSCREVGEGRQVAP
jgi:hypothetical protein